MADGCRPEAETELFASISSSLSEVQLTAVARPNSEAEINYLRSQNSLTTI